MYRKLVDIWTSGVWATRGDGQTDKYTDKQTRRLDKLIAILQTPTGGGGGKVTDGHHQIERRLFEVTGQYQDK